MFNYLPFVYLFNSRLLTSAEKLSWFVIYPFFLILFATLIKLNFILFFLCLVVTMSCYEVGYLFNDFITIKFEENPTIRAGGESSDFSSHFIFHVLFRILISIFICCVIFYFFPNADFKKFILCEVGILFFYVIHNSLRSRINIISYFFLVSLRYASPLIFCLNLKTLIFLLVAFPLCRTIEHACKKKYEIEFLRRVIKNFDLYRVFYYLILVICSIIYWFIFGNWMFSLLSLYFFCFRLICYLLRNTSFASRKKHSSY